MPSYKRLTLMLRDPERLKALLLDPERPIQLVIAGKSHPADDGGKRLIQQMVRFADDPEIRHRIAFLRLCSGKYSRGMRLYHTRLAKEVRVADALTFMAVTVRSVEEGEAEALKRVRIRALPGHRGLPQGRAVRPRRRGHAPRLHRAARLRPL